MFVGARAWNRKYTLFVFFPYSTDAPVYYWPYGTVGLIFVNVFLYYGVSTGALPMDGPWLLQYGSGLNPLEWIGSMFSHAGIGHLLGNMMFLWVFGLVVEGKLGPAKFIACYLGIGVLQSALQQLLMLGYTGETVGSLGASSAIYGVMAMAAVWAPANNIAFFYWIMIMYRGSVDIPVGIVAGFYVGLDLTLALIFGGSAGSSLLHLSGAALGFPLGIWLLKSGKVDCEGWDMFERAGLNEGKKAKEKVARQQDLEDRQQRHQELEEQRRLEALGQLRKFLQQGNAEAALTMYRKMVDSGMNPNLSPTDLAAMIKGLHQAKHWRDSAPFMAELIQRAPQQADPIRLKLAQICVVEFGRPGRALDLISKIDTKGLSEKQRTLAKKIIASAQRMQHEGHVELDEEGW